MQHERFNPIQFPQDPSVNWGLLEARLHDGPEQGSFPSFETPTSLPENLLLPSSLYGDLIAALERQQNTEPQVEESQFIGAQWKSPLFVDTKAAEGDPRQTNPKDEILRIFKKNSATITFWHTHTEYGSPYLTIDDISRSMNFSDRAILTMLGTPRYIWCLVKTKQVPRNTKKIKETLAADKSLWKRIEEVYDNDQRPPDFAALSQYLEKAGYALFVWFNKDGALVRDAAQQGDFEKGIPLQKIGTDPASEIHQDLSQHAQNFLPLPDEVPKIPNETFFEFVGKITGATKLVKRIRSKFLGK
ncbi:MAG: hypothetical protein WAU07_00205 [Microgenomates group bacterium]